MTPLRYLLFALASLLPACLPTDACGCSLAPPYTLDTDSTAYTASRDERDGSYRFRLVVRFRNWSRLPAYLDRCGSGGSAPTYGVLRVAGGPAERSAYDPAWACTGPDDPIVVAPGESRTDTLLIAGPNGWDTEGRPVGALEGDFRIVYGLRNCRGDASCRIPQERSTSNPFRVRLAR